MEQIRIALPSKGRMERETLEFLAGCGLSVKKLNPRQYTATIPTLPSVLVLFQRTRDIPVSVAAGDVDLGVTGYDALVESLNGSDSAIVIHDALDYGECSLVIAVPNEWDDVRSVSDLAYKSAGQSLRIATKFKKTVGRFLAEAGAETIRVVSADGTLESAPTVGYADFIADIVSTGITLRENGLRQLEGGTLLDSQAIFIGNRSALTSRPDVLEVTRQILELIEAYLRARGQYMLFANIRGESAEDVAERVLGQPNLCGLQGPTVAPMITRQEDPERWWAINIVTPASRLSKAIRQIREIGGSGVVVTPVTYIFEELPERYQRLLAALKNEEESA